jgi:hypothetical protein
MQGRPGIELVYTGPSTGMLAKTLGTTSLGLLIAAMSAINDEFRRLLIDLANGGLRDQVSSFTSQALRFSDSLLDSVGSHGGDQNWLIFTALGGAIVLVVWFLRY